MAKRKNVLPTNYVLACFTVKHLPFGQAFKELKHYSKRVGREFPGVVADLCVVNTGPMLIAVSITEMVIPYKIIIISPFMKK